MSEPLSGFRVVELAIALQGPAAAMFLGDMGAEVIKVEPPIGEAARYHRGVNNSLPGEALSSQFIAANRGKKSINLDANSDVGREAILRLIDSADVLLSNFRREALERMGLGYEVLHRRAHTRPPRGTYGRWRRRNHFAHHFANPRRALGVTTPVWDLVFATRLPIERVRVPRRQFGR